MIKRHYYSWQDIERMCIDIVTQMYKDQWKPDYIVGVTRGGNAPASIISNMTNVRCESLKVSLRDDDASESNLWMAEDALGYLYQEEQELLKSRWDIKRRKKILIIDDINDTGATLQWIKQDWEEGCLPNEQSAWQSVWSNNVRFAVLTENQNSNFKHVNYYAHEINKAEQDVWLCYPWETVSTYRTP
jgi:hypoxanthine phosphoribosyltransferase